MRRITIVARAAVAFAVLSLAGAASAGGEGGWLNPEGFRGMPWGTTVEKARSVLPDLAFVRYELEGAKDAPWKLYALKEGAGRIDDVAMDELLYGFRDDAFRKVTAVVRSSVGPRTLETPAAAAFDRLSASITGFAGPRTEGQGGPPEEGKRTSTWRGKGLRVELVLFDPPGANREVLLLTIEREAAGSRPASE